MHIMPSCKHWGLTEPAPQVLLARIRTTTAPPIRRARAVTMEPATAMAGVASTDQRPSARPNPASTTIRLARLIRLQACATESVPACLAAQALVVATFSAPAERLGARRAAKLLPECVSGAYCSNHICVPRKPLGAVCSTIDECASSICGGRCCAAPCTCPQPSAQNLFRNRGL